MKKILGYFSEYDFFVLLQFKICNYDNEYIY